MKRLDREVIVKAVQTGGIMKILADISITSDTVLQRTLCAYRYDTEISAVIDVADSPVQGERTTFTADQIGYFLLSSERLQSVPTKQ